MTKYIFTIDGVMTPVTNGSRQQRHGCKANAIRASDDFSSSLVEVDSIKFGLDGNLFTPSFTDNAGIQLSTVCPACSERASEDNIHHFSRLGRMVSNC